MQLKVLKAFGGSLVRRLWEIRHQNGHNLYNPQSSKKWRLGIKVVSGGRWNVLKRGNHLKVQIYLSKGDEHERVLFAVPSTLQNSPFETQKATLHIHFELLSLPLSIESSLTVTLCQSLNHFALIPWSTSPKVPAIFVGTVQELLNA